MPKTRLLVLMLLATVSMLGQTAARPGTNQQPRFLTTSFDDRLDNVGLNFRGHNIEDIHAKLVALQKKLKRNEFETVAEFERRKKLSDANAFSGSLKISSRFAFVILPVSRSSVVPACNRRWRAEYDADSQQLTISLDSSPTTLSSEDDRNSQDYRTLCVKSKILSERHYVGGTAFGAKVRVRSLIEATYGVAFDPSTWMGTQEFVLPMPVHQARELKPQMQVLLLGRLHEPFTLESVIGRDATVTNPFEHYIDQHFLSVEPEQLWLFDAQSGRVLTKWRPRADP